MERESRGGCGTKEAYLRVGVVYPRPGEAAVPRLGAASLPPSDLHNKYIVNMSRLLHGPDVSVLPAVSSRLSTGTAKQRDPKTT